MDLSRESVESAFLALYKGNEEERESANLFLIEWANAPECYLTAFEIIIESKDLQLRIMALSVLYHQIQIHWNLFDDTFKNSINEYFFKLLSDEISSQEIANTSISIIVLIAINDWPEKRPDYFELIFNLENHLYLFQIISEFLIMLKDCEFVIRSRLSLLRQAFIEHNYIQILISLIQQVNDKIQDQEQSIIDKYTNIFLSIFNSLFIWCDIQLFLSQGIAEFILSKIPNKKAYECLISLFINRTDSSEMLILIFPNLLPSIVENPNSNFLIQFLRKFGRMLEKSDEGYLSNLYSLLLSLEIDVDDMDDFWDLWYVIIHRILFASTGKEEERELLSKIFSPLFDHMRAKFVSFVPLAVCNGRIIDHSAISTWELLNRIDKEGFLSFFSNLNQQQLESEPDERNKIIVDINYCASSINFLIKTTKDQELLGILTDYFTKLLQDDLSIVVIESTIYALSRSTLIISNNLDIFEKFGQLIMHCFDCSDLDLKETAANCFCFALKEIPDFFATTASDFSLFFLDSVDEILKEGIAIDIKNDSYFIMVFRCATLVACSLTEKNEEEDIDFSFFNLIADSVLSVIDDSAPIALKIIAEIGNSSSEMCIFAFKKFWDPLFAYAKMNDSLINEMIIDALISGIVNCPFEKVLTQIKTFVEILLNEMEPEIAVAAISTCRENEIKFDEFYPYFENLLSSPSASLFNLYFAFSPKLVKFETAIPLICDGIVDVDINVCNSALNCIKKFLNLSDDSVCTNLIQNFRAQLLHSVIKSLIDFSHCSLVNRLSSVLIKIIEVSKSLGVENIGIEMMEILTSLCQNEPAEDEFENFVKSLILLCNNKKKAKQTIADFLIMMKSVQITEKVEILKGINEIDDEEKKLIDEIENKFDIKAEE